MQDVSLRDALVVQLARILAARATA